MRILESFEGNISRCETHDVHLTCDQESMIYDPAVSTSDAHHILGCQQLSDIFGNLHLHLFVFFAISSYQDT